MDFMLAQDWHDGINPAGWLMSEKLDGVRVMWNGSQLVSRGGRIINAPEWWTRQLTAIEIDGELWAGRGRFEFVNGAQRRDVPNDSEWREIKLMAFDAPMIAGCFEARHTALSNIPNSESFQVVKHRTCESSRDLKDTLRRIVKEGGEGVVIRRPSSVYQGGRSCDFLRIKPVDDATAVVIGHTQGAGKHSGRVGAIICKTAAGIVFKIGTGLSDMVRQRPPKIGQTVTYQFRGLTKYGVPRHAALV